jgi:hypothetical protein
VTNEDQYARQIDAEQVAQARSKPWPDRSKVRRVRIADGDQPTFPRENVERAMAQVANTDREREGATE